MLNEIRCVKLHVCCERSNECVCGMRRNQNLREKPKARTTTSKRCIQYHISPQSHHSLHPHPITIPHTTIMSRKQAAVDQIVKLIVGAGQASPSPPVGPALGSKGVKSMDFCKVSDSLSLPSPRAQTNTQTRSRPQLTATHKTGIQRPNRPLQPRHPDPRPRDRPPRPNLHL